MKTCIFTIATGTYDDSYRKFINSLHKFHPDIEVFRINDKEIAQANDKNIFYRAKPYFAKQFFDKGCELVIGMDVDQIITGSLDRILKGDYEVGTVLNYNRVDPPRYGLVSVGTIDPDRYFNAGLVAMTSKKFVDHWLRMCYTPHFDRLQYREQDLLNILTHYGDYDVICFDAKTDDYSAWHGLISKGEGLKMKVTKHGLILPKQIDGYPMNDKLIKVLHNAGGANERPVGETFKTQFNEDVIKYIEDLIK